ncbi:ABC transporter ATP-binding protein [Gluconobacter oxydans]|uniref:Nitrate/sulfonate/bicarbonate transporter ATP-binding protein n=1 Tax=Gluconobacter oxydans NBRC 3293 TaxID=1315969 RepID=A0A829WYN9_GLUOY|nr:ABC transporter ATP-binding protein [Gluconobacter oxydans]GEM15777.1 nitrate/sulfonate/bicarbonate transporter ATP-binding protein [Gluconobacter oxydans NBRC 3293]
MPELHETGSAPKLRFDHLSKAFASSPRAGGPILGDIEFDIAAGEFVVLVGPSGCGKSTLLDLAAGLTDPTAGRVLLDGRPVTKPGPERSVVFQNYALLPWKTALENIVFALAAAGVARGERHKRARHFLDLVGLEHAAHRYPHQLSGGMNQRVAIARSLSVEPEVLLMDEPFGALDAQTRETLQTELRRLWKRTSATIIFITHDIDEALSLGQKVVVLAAGPGRIVDVVTLPFPADASIDDVRAHPQYGHLRHYVRSLLSHGAGRA